VSNLGSRVLVAIVAIPAIVACAWFGGYLWALFVAAVTVLALTEYAAMARAKDAAPQTVLMIAASLALLLVFLHERLARDVSALAGGGFAWPLRWQALLWVALLLGLVAPLIELYRRGGSPLRNLAATHGGVWYIGLFLASAVGVREIFCVSEFPVARVFGAVDLSVAQRAQLDAWGGGTVIALLAAIWMCDTAAYFGGRAMGRHKLFPRVSPNKTWEGAVWGFAAAVGTLVAARALGLSYLSAVDAVVLGGVVGVLGQFGDLVESLLKRDAGVKDSSALLPGHGGVFDRFDSFIFVAPAVFLYLDFIVFA
jgi:phosphatidate cytidylyltransferase